jgi:hypothetical protein
LNFQRPASWKPGDFRNGEMFRTPQRSRSVIPFKARNWAGLMVVLTIEVDVLHRRPREVHVVEYRRTQVDVAEVRLGDVDVLRRLFSAGNRGSPVTPESAVKSGESL